MSDNPLAHPGSPQSRRLVLLAVAVVTVMGTLGSAFSPALLVHYPLALLALSPDIRHLVLVAAQVDYGPALAAGLPRRAAGLAAMYGVGFFYGPVALLWFEQKAPRLGGALRWFEALFARFGAPLLVLFPVYTLGALAGAAGTRLKVFVPAMLLGQALYITAGYYLGDAVTEWTQPFVRWLTEHIVASTLVCVALVGAQQLWSRRGKQPTLGE